MKIVKNSKKIEGPNINYQAGFLTVCPLAPRARKIEYLNYKGKKKEGYETEFFKKMGNTELTIIGKKKYGFPNGRDILVILYLIREALLQNNEGIIVIKTPLTDYLDTFEIDKSEKGYTEAKTRFKRIRYSSWYWDEGDGEKIEQNSVSYQIIRRWSVFFDKKEMHPLFESYIQLDPDFWNYIKNKKIPYDLNIVKKIKDKPILLNLYLLLVYRTYEIWNSHPNQTVFIPFYSEKGLMNQLSANFTRNRDFKTKLINKWLPIIQSEWKDCPCFVERITPAGKNFKRNKIYKDGLTIHVESVSQLHILPHLPKKLRQAKEEAKKEAEKTKKTCPDCGDSLELREGKKISDGKKLADYLRCKKCKKNLYQNDYPAIYD